MSARPKKGQINTLPLDQCKNELQALNLDTEGGVMMLRKRLREALYPNPSNSSQPSQLLSQQSQPVNQSSQNLTADIPVNSNEHETTINTSEVNFTKQGPVFKRIPKAS